MLKEMECLVGCIGLLVKSLAGCLCLIVLIDGSEVNIGISCLKFIDLAVKSVTLQLGAHLSKLLVTFCQVGMVLDERLGEAAELLQALPAWQLAVHFTLELS